MRPRRLIAWPSLVRARCRPRQPLALLKPARRHSGRTSVGPTSLSTELRACAEVRLSETVGGGPASGCGGCGGAAAAALLAHLPPGHTSTSGCGMYELSVSPTRSGACSSVRVRVRVQGSGLGCASRAPAAAKAGTRAHLQQRAMSVAEGDAMDAELGAPAHQVRQPSHVDGLVAEGQAQVRGHAGDGRREGGAPQPHIHLERAERLGEGEVHEVHRVDAAQQEEAHGRCRSARRRRHRCDGSGCDGELPASWSASAFAWQRTGGGTSGRTARDRSAL
eukprot:scaffold77224_cov48-Phaeocystis_antarctica.AAC.2